MPRGGSRPNAGRPRGSLDKTTPEVKAARRDFCSSVIDDPDYQSKLRKRIKEGKAAPAVECMVWYYARGKPTETHEVTGADGAPLAFTWQSS